jgi:hypothetical protein
MIKVLTVIAGTLVLAGGAAMAQQVSSNVSRRFRLRERSDRPELGISRRGRVISSSSLACGALTPTPIRWSPVMTLGFVNPRTIIEVRRLNQDDIVEVEDTFYAPIARSRKK